MRATATGLSAFVFGLMVAGCSPKSKPEQYLTIHRLHSSTDLAPYVITRDIDEGRKGLTKQVILANTLDFATKGNSVDLIMHDAVVLQARIPSGALSEGSSTPQEVARMDTLTLSLPETSLVLFNSHLIPAPDLMKQSANGITEYVGEEAEKALRETGLQDPSELDLDMIHTNRAVPEK